MNLREYVVLDALNIASTQYGKWDREAHERHFQATTAQIVEVFKTDSRFVAERRIMGFNTRSMGASLGRLGRGMPIRREPLVRRVGTKKWRLTDAGVKVLSA